MTKTEIYRPVPQQQQAPQNTALAPTPETAGMVLAAQARALVEARYVVALRQPRDLDVVRSQVLRTCKHPGFADDAIYHKPVGDGIEGPSIRLVECILAEMGNISTDVVAIYDDLDKRIVRITVSDNQKNGSHSADVTVRKAVERAYVKDGDEVISSRQNSKGKMTFLRRATDDEILNTQNALVSKALRTLGLRLIPSYIVREALDTCRATLGDRNAVDPEGQKKKLFDSFSEIGVPVAELKAYLGHDRPALTPAELTELRGVYAAIRDGETTWDDVASAKASRAEAEEDRKAQAKPLEVHATPGAVQATVDATLAQAREVATQAAPTEASTPPVQPATVPAPGSPPAAAPSTSPGVATPAAALPATPSVSTPAPQRPVQNGPRPSRKQPESLKDRMARIQAGLNLDGTGEKKGQ